MSICLHKSDAVPQVWHAGAEVEATLVSRRQFQPLSMDFLCTLSPFLWQNMENLAFKNHPFFYKTWRTHKTGRAHI